ncbi:MAG: FKBP-type peptidyl-prolyl cis-trans isomerase [Bacteroidales bacterium]|nr:FKBP-type peptidyl-prolyl cis-trans isomerase [Bacteroidales bacterium]
MKKQFTTIFAIFLTISLSAQEPTNLETPSDTAHYTVGAFVAKWLQNNGMAISDFEMFRTGMTDVQEGNELAIPDSTINQRVASYQVSIQSNRNRQLEAQLFEDLRGKAGVGALPNGVHYIVMTAGEGALPMANDSIVINAVGVFPNGTMFENTLQSGNPIRTTMNDLIPGLKAAMQFMRQGSQWRIFIPAALGYGPAGLQNIIPPNMALVYEITLEEVIGN